MNRRLTNIFAKMLTAIHFAKDAKNLALRGKAL